MTVFSKESVIFFLWALCFDLVRYQGDLKVGFSVCKDITDFQITSHLGLGLQGSQWKSWNVF